MATKKKRNKKPTKSKKTAAKSVTTAKRLAKKRSASKKAKGKPTLKKLASKKRVAARKAPGRRVVAAKKQTRERTAPVDAVAFSRARRVLPAEEEAGDLQGLRRVEDVDSESVEELLEEGNAFEAGVVGGVESADNADEKEVHTHEVPEDDVPEEYLDEDR